MSWTCSVRDTPTVKPGKMLLFAFSQALKPNGWQDSPFPPLDRDHVGAMIKGAGARHDQHLTSPVEGIIFRIPCHPL